MGPQSAFKHPYPLIYYCLTHGNAQELFLLLFPGDRSSCVVTNRPFYVIAAILPCNADGLSVSL